MQVVRKYLTHYTSSKLSKYNLLKIMVSYDVHAIIQKGYNLPKFIMKELTPEL